MPQIEKDYVNTGKVKYIFRDFPLESIHQNAFKAAQAGRCAGEQGKFWEMHDQLYANQQALSPEDLAGYAQKVGLDVPLFKQCLESGHYDEAIRKDIADAQGAGLTGTPSFFLGLTGTDGTPVKVLRTIKGAQAYTAFKSAIDSLLAGQ